MPSDRDYEFARIAVELELLTQEQADSLLADLRAAEALGASDSLAQIAVKRGLLGDADCQALDERVDRALGQRVEVGGFEILERIGRGGMGAVYRARQLSMGRVVALKILSTRLAQSETYVKRFIREARAAAKLDHPNIVQGITVGKSSGYYYFAMEYINGESVAQRLKRAGPLPEEEALGLCVQMARALDHAHSRANIIHRDVKPQNILLAVDGTAKLADLGLAREAVQADGTVTFTGVTLGTPDYISPEQIRGEGNLDGRCDIYSLGATLYHMITGKPPFRGETANVTMARHLTDPVPDPMAEGAAVSPATTAIIRKAMQKEKARRYQSAREMGEALEAVARRLGPLGAVPAAAPVRPSPVSRRRPPARNLAPVAVAIVAILTVLGLLLFVATRPGNKASRRRTDRREARADEDEPDPVEPPDEPEPPKHPSQPDKPDQPDQPDKPAPPPRGRAELELARKLIEANKGQPWRTIAEVQRLLDANLDKAYKDEIEWLLAREQESFRLIAKETLDELVARAGRLALKGTHAEALRVLDEFPQHLRQWEWPARVDRAKRRIEDQVYRATDQAARAAADDGDFDQAVRLMRQITQLGVPGLSQTAEEAIRALETEKKQHEREASTRRTQATVTYMVKITTALESRDCETARRVAADAAKDPVLGKEAERFRLLQDDARELQALWDEARRRLETMKPGTDIRLKSILRKFVKYEGGVITASTSGMVETLPLKQMGEVDLFGPKGLLTSLYAPGGTDPRPYVQRGLLFTFDKDRKLAKAGRDFDTAERLGAADAAARGRSYIEFLTRLEPEQAGIKLLAEARMAAERGDWATVETRLRELSAHAKTEAYRKNRTELTRLLLRAAGRGRGLPRLFSGQAVLKGADDITVTYDLRRPEQQADWRGGVPGKQGLVADRQLRWNAGIHVRSIRLACRYPGRRRISRVEVRVLCSPQGKDPAAAAGFGEFRGRGCYVGSRVRKRGTTSLRPQTDFTVELTRDEGVARLSIDGAKNPVEAPVDGLAGGRSIFIVPDRVPIEVSAVTIRGRLDLDWARQRAADLADVADGTLLAGVDVAADKEWVATQVTLEPNKYYHLVATGWWKHGRFDWDRSSAAGEPNTRDYMPLYSLVARVGGRTLYVGEEAVVGPFLAGRLELAMNDRPERRGDNQGALRVTVRRLPPSTRRAPELAPGLLGAYYSGPDFNRFLHAKATPLVDLPEKALKEAAGQAEDLSARWTGYLKITKPDQYEFGVSADDGFRLWLDGRELMERWRLGDRNRGRTRPIALEKGLYPVRLEYFQGKGDARLHLWWWWSDKRRGEPVPAEAFFHSKRRAEQLGAR